MLNLQSLIAAPRESPNNARVAKIEHAIRTIGEDGKLYRMLEEKDHSKYKLSSNEQIRDDEYTTREIKEIYSPSKSKSNKGISLNAPQFGTASRSKKIEAKAWENELKSSQVLKMDSKSLERSALQSELLKNTINNNNNNNEQVITENDDPEEENENIIIKNSIAQADTSQLMSVIALMKENYEKNLSVIDKLYIDKVNAEKKVKILESKLGISRLGLDSKKNHNNNDTGVSEIKIINTIKPMSSINEGVVPIPKRLQRLQEKALRPQSANIIRNSVDGMNLNKTLPNRPRPSSAGPTRPVGSIMNSTVRKTNITSSIDKTQNDTNVPPSYRAKGLSQNLLQDQQKYIEKQRLIEEREYLKQFDGHRTQREIDANLARASLQGKEFTAMMIRSEQAREKNLLKLEAKKKAAEDAEAKEIEEYNMKKFEKLNSRRNDTMTWAEMELKDKIEKALRVEKRKLELSSKMNMQSVPGSDENLGDLFGGSGTRRNSKKIEEDAAVKAAARFKAEDPSKVTERLERYQKGWLKKEEEDKKRKERAKNEVKLRTKAASNTGMDERTLKQQLRKEEKQKELKIKEDEEKKIKLQNEKKKLEKLQNLPVPEASRKLTRAAELKALVVKEKFEKEKLEEEKEKKKILKKEKQLRTAGAVLKTIINLNDQDRKAKFNFIELRQADQNAAAAEIAKEEFKNVLKENKKKRDEKVNSTRVSLIDLQTKKEAKVKAGSEALLKIAAVVDDDDFFEDEELFMVRTSKKIEN